MGFIQCLKNSFVSKLLEYQFSTVKIFFDVWNVFLYFLKVRYKKGGGAKSRSKNIGVFYNKLCIS